CGRGRRSCGAGTSSAADAVRPLDAPRRTPPLVARAFTRGCPDGRALHFRRLPPRGDGPVPRIQQPRAQKPPRARRPARRKHRMPGPYNGRPGHLGGSCPGRRGFRYELSRFIRGGRGSVRDGDRLAVVADGQPPQGDAVEAGRDRLDAAVAEDELDHAGVVAAEAAGGETGPPGGGGARGGAPGPAAPPPPPPPPPHPPTPPLGVA